MKPDEIHLWLTDLDVPGDELERLSDALPGEERDQAAAFRFSRDRARFVAGRTALRTILAGYLRADPARIWFSRGPFGKPALAADFEGSNLQFNVSHSGKLHACGVTRRREIGVDVEELRTSVANTTLADMFLSARMLAETRSHDAANGGDSGGNTAAFFNAWVRKEACVKAWGLGASISWKHIDVPIEGLARMRRKGRTWTVASVKAHPNYAAAIAVEGEPDFILRLCWLKQAGPAACFTQETRGDQTIHTGFAAVDQRL